MSFWYKVSSESGYDYFNFYIDVTEAPPLRQRQLGPVHGNLAVGSTHILKWEYVKDSGVSGGSDTVWIDDLSALTGDATTWTDIIALTEVGATAASWTPPARGTDYKACGRCSAAATTAPGTRAMASSPSWPARVSAGRHELRPERDVRGHQPVRAGPDQPRDVRSAYPTCPILNGDINQDGAARVQ